MDLDFGPADEQLYREVVKTLASDEFLGRKPFTKGETLTLDYLEKTFKKVGLKPGNGDSFFQEVPMVEIEAVMKNGEAEIHGVSDSMKLHNETDMVGGTKRVIDKVSIENAPLVFAGFGINAPEFDWNDYRGVDVKGKVVVVMVNDPGYYHHDLFRGTNMTYYGRWMYKFEEAARQGAVGVLIIHDTAPASYGWGVLQNSLSGPQLSLQTADDNLSTCAFNGWITTDAANQLFKTADFEPADLLEKAKQPGFRPVDLELKFSVSLENKIVKKLSNNVAGIIPGTDLKDEVVIYSAHWDHLGVGPMVDGENIYHGAIDNATGVAALVVLAKKVLEGSRPRRTIVFLSLTGEESGLLGSEYYAHHPLFPLKKTAVDINFDMIHPIGLLRDIYLTSKGYSNADQFLEEAAKELKREVRALEDLSSGVYYRSDHFNFAKVGVPTIDTETGIDSIEHGEEWGRRQHKENTRLRYHKPQDKYHPDWDLSGTMADLKLMYATGLKIANADRIPEWYDGVSYKKAREKQS